MENKVNLKKENEINSNKEQTNDDSEEKMLIKIFCPLCHQFPEYSIIFGSSSNFSLIHECLDGKIIKSSIDFEKESDPYTFSCFYCKKNCNHICVKCKYVMCQKCSKKHIKNPYALTKKTKKLESTNKSIICIMNSQYICENHLLQYKFYCPVCKINLCQKCKEEHFHINCPSLNEQKLLFKEINEPSNDCFKKLFKLAKLFYSCFDKNLSNSRMTLNILLNTHLAHNILSIIQDNSNNEGKEIRNNFLNDINEKLFLCEGNGSSNFEQYFSNLLIKANSGNISAYKILNGIIEKYEREYKMNLYNKYILRQSYLSSLNFQIESLINKINFAAIKIDLNETNIILANCLKMINDLKLKNDFFEFCLQLLKIISLKMNYKLDYELRRKIGNIISTIMLKNFNKNLEPIQKSKKLLLFSSEYLKKKMNETTPTKNNKNFEVKDEGFESLKSKYKLALKMLNDEILDELAKIDMDNSKLFANDNINIISFKNLSEETEEINKVVICNLFFTIKWKLGDEFNHQIHNVTHSINSLLVEEINALENNQNENINSNDDEDNQNENGQNTTSESEKNQLADKKIIQNIICPKKYGFLDLLNNMQYIEKKAEVFDEIIEIEDDDPILESSIDDFVKVIKDIKLTYCTSSNISIEDSLDLYLDGKKGNILKRDISDKKVDNIIEKINKISQEDKPKIDKISKLADKIKNQLESNLSFLSRLMDIILENLEKLWKCFGIKELFEKYEIEQPLNPLEEINSFDINSEDETKEEIYFLILVLNFFFIKPKINEILRLKNDFEKININEIIKQNILKKKIIKNLTQNIRDFNMSSLISKVWNKLRDYDQLAKFVEDIKINTLMKNYLKNKTEEDFKFDLINLIKPYCKKLDLDTYDPQNITVEPFMIQNHLLD